MYDAMSLCRSEERGDKTYYVIDPSVMYPATVARMKEVKASGEVPQELIATSGPMIRSLDSWKRMLRRQLSDDDLDLVIKPYQDIKDAAERERRVFAMRMALKWFKQALRAKGAITDGKNNVLRIHIINENSPEQSAYKE